MSVATASAIFRVRLTGDLARAAAGYRSKRNGAPDLTGANYAKLHCLLRSRFSNQRRSRQFIPRGHAALIDTALFAAVRTDHPIW
jgi:hypothetical protein